jgi:hypothetical protein
MSRNQIVFSVDTTGSMYSCLGQVRRCVEETVKELFNDIPELEIGVITHGDYCDGPHWLSKLGLSNNKEAICTFIKNSPPTGGGDANEAYEAVIHEARTFAWDANAEAKAFVLIADANPHPVGYRYGGHVNKFNWQDEAKALHAEHNVLIYSVQCLGSPYSKTFYETLAELGNGYKLDLNQFAIITDLLKAICYKQANQLPVFEKKLETSGKTINIDLLRSMDILSGRKPRERKRSAMSMYAVHPARFQILDVDTNTPIKDFVQHNGLLFKTGRGFYEFTKPVLVQEYKEVIIQDRETGEMFSGDKAREMLGIPIGVRANVSPGSLTKYRGFIQSTSNNRKLLAGTKFLYEVNELAGS